MDRRLKLTDKQKELVKKLKEDFAALEEAHVSIFYDFHYGDFCLFNNSESLSFDMSDEYGMYEEEYFEEPKSDYFEDTEEGCIWYSPKDDDLEKLESIVIPTDYFHWFAVELKENEDSEAYFRSKRVAELEKEVKKNRKKLKRHLDNIEESESNISIFKEKGLPQDLIDEEQASILSNREAANKYQKVIEDLESEIKKLKEA